MGQRMELGESDCRVYILTGLLSPIAFVLFLALLTLTAPLVF